MVLAEPSALTDLTGDEKAAVNERILLVEDDPVARLALAELLCEAGYHVECVPNGEQAASLVQERSYELLICDMWLPDMNGIAVLQIATQGPRPPAVLLLTGHGTVETVIAAIRMGAIDYLLKPVQPAVLFAAISKALARRAETLQRTDLLIEIASRFSDLRERLISSYQQQDLSLPMVPAETQPSIGEDGLRIGDLQLGRFYYETSYAGQLLNLTPIEFALLYRLASTPYATVHYQELIQVSHGYLPGLVEAQKKLKVHIRNLRQKVGATLIENVRGMGYRLNLPRSRAPE